VISAKVREEVLWSGPCAYCGSNFPAQVDHVIPRSRGGSDDRANLAPACRPCNMEKLNFTPEEYRAYREENGLGWPPKSPEAKLKEIVREAAEVFGVTEREAMERVARSWSYHSERRREAERAAEIEALTAEHIHVEACIRECRGGPLNRLLRRLDEIDARLDLLRG
jgi:HNH endonuclease